MVLYIRTAIIINILFSVSQVIRGEVECRAGAIDLVFVMDQSGSIKSADFKIGLRAAANLTKSLDIGSRQDQSRVAFVLFDSSASVAFNFAAYQSNSAVESAIVGLPYSGGGTNIAIGMDVAIKQLFNTTARGYVPRVMIIITDGQDDTDVASEHQLAAGLNILVYALGVGPDVDANELALAAGDSSRVFSAANYGQLSEIMAKVCEDIVTVAPPTPINVPKSCGCDYESDYLSAWLDIVFILDSSSGVANNDFTSMKALLSQMGMSYQVGPVGSDGKKYTRIAIVNVGANAQRVANFTKYNSGTDLRNDVKTLTRIGGDYNPEAGVKEAQLIIDQEAATGRRLNVRKVVVLFSSIMIDCREQNLLRVINGKAVDNKELCRLVAVMEGEKTTVVTIAIKLPGQDFPLVNIGNPCNQFRNDDNMVLNIMKSLCLANCYCLDPYTQFETNETCAKYGECVFVQEFSFSYQLAKITCEDENSTVSTITSYDKDDFLRELHVKAEFFPFWVGRQRVNGKWIHDDGTPVDALDYRNWCAEKGETEDKSGDCVFVNQCTAFKTGWFHSECGTMLPTHFFSCQKESCSTKNYCDFH